MENKINQLFLEAIEGVRVIRAFNKQQHEIDRFKDSPKLFGRLLDQMEALLGDL